MIVKESHRFDKRLATPLLLREHKHPWMSSCRNRVTRGYPHTLDTCLFPPLNGGLVPGSGGGSAFEERRGITTFASAP